MFEAETEQRGPCSLQPQSLDAQETQIDLALAVAA